MPRTTPRAMRGEMKRSASTTPPDRLPGAIRCASWSEAEGAGGKSGYDPVRELVEEVGGVQEGEGEAGDGVFCEEFVNVAADEIGAAEAAGLNGKAFGLQPFLQKGNLGGAAGAVHTFD